MRFFYHVLFFIFFETCISFVYGQSTTLISSTGNGGFETGTTFAANGWTEVNGTPLNKWYVGTQPSGYTGLRCAYISKAVAGAGTAYSLNQLAVVHFYRDVTFPAGQDLATLTFKWKCNGESNLDYLKVYLVPTTTTPAAGVQLISGQFGTTYNLNPSSWTSTTITVCGVAGTTQRLVFSWTNDATSGAQPPAEVDDISLVSSVVGTSCSAVLGTGVTAVSSLPYNSGSGTTQSAANDITTANAITCGSSLYFSGEDKVWEFTPTQTGQVTISLTSTGTYTGLMLYDGCPIANVCSGIAGTCVAYTQSTTGNKSMCVTVTAGDTYYLLLDSYSTPFYNPYSNLYISAPVPTSSSNDIPCNATSLTLGVNLAGDNSCASGTGEPTMPSCWSGSTNNTLWYSVVCPASGKLRIRTISGTLTDTQIGLYTGTCSSLTTIAAWCNDNAPACGTSAYSNSELIINSGLVAGTTYYIVIDGAGTNTGSFDIQVTDGSLPVVPAAGQECGSVNPVCNQSISVGNPGFGAFGKTCDFPATAGNCLLAGERGSAWYEIVISAAGNLQFDIVPNDWPGTGTSSTDYDFAIWKTAGTGAVTCAEIAAGTVNPLRCNYSFLGVTGCNANTVNTAPAAYPGFGAAYEKRITVASGEKYQLVVSNYTNSSSGFTLNIDPAAPVNYSAPTQVIWSGGSNNTWTTTGNWGGCVCPTCTIDAVVSPSASNQPILLSATTYNARDVTINAGATLTLMAGSTLNICGNFYNYGSIVADPTSTIAFTGTGTQNIYGSLVGPDKFGNVLINKASGSVILNAGLEIAGNFTVQNSTSIFNVNGQYMKLAGNFTNASGSTTFTGVTNSTLEFNGIVDQNYTPGGSLTLNKVLINQGVASAVVLVGNPMTISGTLTLTSGRIETLLNEVNVTSNAATAVNSGNINSYVDGDLRRATAATGSYDFPVGNYLSGKGYQLANINFTSANTATNLLAHFKAYSVVPPALGVLDCGINYNLEALDNGSWTISSTPSTSTGTYDVTLYNTAGSYTNSAGSSSWTVMKKPSAGSWALNGTCSTSTISQVTRVGLSGFSDFGTSQSTELLPVEVISFTAVASDLGNQVDWITAAEFNNDYFSLEKSADGQQFAEINRQQGASNTYQEHHYHYTDDAPILGINYYRLKQVNNDSSFGYSNVVALENKFPTPEMMPVHPNPTTGILSFEMSTTNGGLTSFAVMDLFGKEVYKSNHTLATGINSVEMDLSQLPKGVYLIECNLSQYGFVKMEKVILQ
ncbi:MAG: T9SS type A sorting domain-containing protein [Chitinophagales bacterium]